MIFDIFQYWILGAMFTKTLCLVCMVGPNCWLKTNLHLMYTGGIRNLDVNLVIVKTAVPVMFYLGFFLAAPYFTAHVIAPEIVPTEYLVSNNRLFLLLYP